VHRSGTFVTSPAFNIRLAAGTEREQRMADQLRRILGTYDVSNWVRTHEILIEAGATPFSHPVLRLNTRHANNDDQLLSTFLHEQIHWILTEKRGAVSAAMKELRGHYPTLPVGHPEGGSDLASSYLHVFVNYLELLALEATIGEARAQAVFALWLSDHYAELYRIVLRDRDLIGEIVSRHGLLP
jgi:hypothetical protein